MAREKETYAPHLLPQMRDEQPNRRVARRCWQPGGAYDRSLFTAKSIWEKTDCVHLNPVEAGLCARPQD